MEKKQSCKYYSVTVDQPFYMDVCAEHCFFSFSLIMPFYIGSVTQTPAEASQMYSLLIGPKYFIKFSSQSGHFVADELDSFHSVGFKSESSIVNLV